MNSDQIKLPSNPHTDKVLAVWGPYFVYGEDTYLFEWLKRLFSKPAPVADTQPAPVSNTEKMSVKTCKSCGKPISYDPSWEHIPNYCRECRAKFKEQKG